MSVHLDFISVIVRRDAVHNKFSGGWTEFLNCVPNKTLSTDDYLASVCFMSPLDADAYIRRLELGGLIYVQNGQAADIAVVDEFIGSTIPVVWLEFGDVTCNEQGDEVHSCRLVGTSKSKLP